MWLYLRQLNHARRNAITLTNDSLLSTGFPRSVWKMLPNAQIAFKKIHLKITSAQYHLFCFDLTHWGRVKHICVCKLTIIGSDNGLSPGRRQAIILTKAGILLIGPLSTNFSEISSDIHSFSFKKMYLKRSSAKWRPFCFGLNVLKRYIGQKNSSPRLTHWHT